MIKKLMNKWLNGKKETPVEQPQTQDDTLPKAISFQQGFDLTGFPVVTLNQGKRKFNFILDTGSTDCIINASVLCSLNYTMLDTQVNWHGVEGNAVRAEVCKTTFSFKGQDFPFEYVIGDMAEAFKKIKKETGVTLHGILGSNFFNEFKYVIDFQELIAYSKL